MSTATLISNPPAVAPAPIETRTSSSAGRLHLVIGGHVDHGKSTLIGRLLADTGSLPEGKLDAVRASCARNSKPFEYAFLLDALKDEQAQGITIDAARVFFRTAQRPYILIDAPGHIEFLRNLITGAARAEAALLVIDAKEGVRENSRRHGYLMGMLGIRQIAVVVNKMDLVGYDRAVFARIETEYRAFLAQAGVVPERFIPVSGREGENIARRSTRMAWHDGPTVLETLDLFRSEAPAADKPFRMPVQDVYKFTAQGDERRIVAGTVNTGSVSVGDEVVFWPSGKSSRVASVEAFNRPAGRSAAAGEATGFTLEEQIYVGRGELATVAGQPKPQVGTRIRASVFWLGRQPLAKHRDYVLKIGSAKVTARVEEIHRVLDASNLSSVDAKPRVDRHEVAELTLRTHRPVACDLACDLSLSSRFVLVDDFEIRGGGIVKEVFSDARGAARDPLSVIWFTGLSGSGKSTIAERLVETLRADGRRVEYLDGDAVRSVLPAGFSRAERDAHIKRVGFLASRLEANGVTVVASFVSPYREARDAARAMCRRFIEVHVSTPLDVCERRDVKGLYARARRGEVANFTGVSDPYEAPLSPEVAIDTSRVPLEEAVKRVLEEITGGRS
jgi:bifunctional enzyme CysN/CysC